MWWPFRRSTEDTGVDNTATAAKPLPNPTPVGEWRRVPVLQRVSGDIMPVAPFGQFAGGLASHQDPRFIAPLAHELAADGPSGEVTGLAEPVPATGADSGAGSPGDRVIQRFATAEHPAEPHAAPHTGQRAETSGPVETGRPRPDTAAAADARGLGVQRSAGGPPIESPSQQAGQRSYDGLPVIEPRSVPSVPGPVVARAVDSGGSRSGESAPAAAAAAADSRGSDAGAAGLPDRPVLADVPAPAGGGTADLPAPAAGLAGPMPELSGRPLDTPGISTHAVGGPDAQALQLPILGDSLPPATPSTEAPVVSRSVEPGALPSPAKAPRPGDSGAQISAGSAAMPGQPGAPGGVAMPPLPVVSRSSAGTTGGAGPVDMFGSASPAGPSVEAARPNPAEPVESPLVGAASADPLGRSPFVAALDGGHLPPAASPPGLQRALSPTDSAGSKGPDATPARLPGPSPDLRSGTGPALPDLGSPAGLQRTVSTPGPAPAAGETPSLGPQTGAPSEPSATVPLASQAAMPLVSRAATPSALQAASSPVPRAATPPVSQAVPPAGSHTAPPGSHAVSAPSTPVGPLVSPLSPGVGSTAGVHRWADSLPSGGFEVQRMAGEPGGSSSPPSPVTLPAPVPVTPATLLWPPAPRPGNGPGSVPLASAHPLTVGGMTSGEGVVQRDVEVIEHKPFTRGGEGAIPAPAPSVQEMFGQTAGAAAGLREAGTPTARHEVSRHQVSMPLVRQEVSMPVAPPEVSVPVVAREPAAPADGPVSGPQDEPGAGTPGPASVVSSITPGAPAPTPGAPSPTAAAADLDELAKRLYDPLTARLRAELWLDRERAGMVTDRWR